MALLTVTERRWEGQHTRGTKGKCWQAASETPSHMAGIAAVSREGSSENTKMLKTDNRASVSLEALQVTLRITGDAPRPLSGAKALA